MHENSNAIPKTFFFALWSSDATGPSEVKVATGCADRRRRRVLKVSASREPRSRAALLAEASPSTDRLFHNQSCATAFAALPI